MTSAPRSGSTRLAALAIAAVVGLAAAGLASVAYSRSNDYAAVVDGSEISERRFLREVEQFQENERFHQLFQGLAEARDGRVPSRLAALWLTRLIQHELVEREIEEREIEVTDAHRQQARQIQVQQFRQQDVFEGFDEWFRELLVERDAAFVAVSEAVAGDEPTEEELREAYEADPDAFASACVRHILVETEERAEELASRLAEEADFAELAREHSVDRGSAERGGDLGCQPKGTYVPAFEEAVFDVAVGEVSDPVESEFGWHLILVESREEGTFEQARPQLEERLRTQAQQEFGRVLLERATEADVVVNPKYGSFEATAEGPQVVAPEAPQPPSGLPVGGDGGPAGSDLPVPPQPPPSGQAPPSGEAPPGGGPPPPG